MLFDDTYLNISVTAINIVHTIIGEFNFVQYMIIIIHFTHYVQIRIFYFLKPVHTAQAEQF